jgi:hypothetical protein
MQCRKWRPKKEGEDKEHCIFLCTPTIYGDPPKIIFDKKVPLTCKKFAKVYGLCNIGPSPKKLKLGLNSIEKQVLELFKPFTNKNGYHYSFNNNPKLVKHIEELWMITHHCVKMLTTRISTKL